MLKRTGTPLLAALALCAGLWTSCQPQTSTPEKLPAAGTPSPAKAPPTAPAKTPGSAAPDARLPKDAVKGDFDGDGTTDYVWLVPPEVLDEMECKGECTSYLHFSNAQWPTIPMRNCIGGEPRNLGDLNGNGGDEIGLLPEWFTSCWSEYYVFTYRAGKWEHLVKPFSTHCNQWEAEVKPIEKDPAQKGHVLIRYTDFADTTFAVQTKSVPVE